MKVWNIKSSNDKYIIKGIIQCNRDELIAVRAAISLITNFKGKKVVFHTLGISGTIKAATKKFIKLENKHK